jgi:lipopolysaccharide/colanic/teichoic acid biosynthesis glycosyltransferase
LQREWLLGFRPIEPGIGPEESQGDLLMSTAPEFSHAYPRVTTAIVIVPERASAPDFKILSDLPFAQVILVPSWFDVQTLWVSARDMAGTLGLEMNRGLLLLRNRILKRLLDGTLALLALLVTMPVMVTAALLVFLNDPGWPFYVQCRRGLNDRVIRILKIRTMYRDAELRLAECLRGDPAAQKQWATYFKLNNDPRIIRGIGHFLRSSSIDELPQLWNVLKGDMSLVGPRPFPDYHLDAFDDAFKRTRATVIPGLTGLWQVQARSEGDIGRQRELDRYYILNWSIWMDIIIICRTVLAVLSTRGAW